MPCWRSPARGICGPDQRPPGFMSLSIVGMKKCTISSRKTVRGVFAATLANHRSCFRLALHHIRCFDGRMGRSKGHWMRVVIGVDWSDQAFAAVTQTFQLYDPTDVTLVHAVDLGILQHPIVAQAGNVQGYEDFRRAMVDAGHKVLDHAATMVPPAIQSIRKVNEVGSPAQLILDSADHLSANLVVVGARGQSRLSEVVLGSVSHRLLLHGSARP